MMSDGSTHETPAAVTAPPAKKPPPARPAAMKLTDAADPQAMLIYKLGLAVIAEEKAADVYCNFRDVADADSAACIDPTHPARIAQTEAHNRYLALMDIRENLLDEAIKEA